ncbi:LysR family transcriptional regulator ArgP [Glaciibacter psychrotolerans]|uniref:LysR family transcriptional regulator (Chromosome initiation inhibitor) n=1 Tax=Glaciibacter psychrotolerans TaxID=670054 RepID=A0A7Z0J794_9MICO|nr:LysR family transcriptional regulator ArgP [Leifsonia psychrotolerans]NYJ21367.1 LysR family transcriptional regulator (chromosome initiation inhibitor) [Leifsonia psychrotolerans]
MMDLQLDQLRALLAVVDRGTFDAAARQLQVTPSAISQRIKALELAVGRVLLQRVKPVRPTASGEVVLRLARQFALLENDALTMLEPEVGEAASASERFISIPLVINSDSLATWALPALARVPAAHRISFDIFREDQDHSTARLRDGTVMAAITSASEPVQGCIVRPLGAMRYRPMASPEFVATWFSDGPTVASLAVAPVVIYDRTDDLQDRYLRQRTRTLLHPPQHFVPASSEFATAVQLGLGWGMLPDAQSQTAEASGALVEIDPGEFIDVALYWQQWKLHSPTLSAVADAIGAAAAAQLR